MDDKMFSRTIRVAFDEGSERHAVGSVREATELLMSTEWPRRGERHREAAETCMKVQEGARSTVDAERAFAEAAVEAGILLRD